ncbi:unnamed protein product [Calicophoron daubneyi]|uniref:Uncharacterized protein n=1 Tax=Calicophoron daubneyi TaxID=300641 RepID=A0AAV2T3N3_CALDB
MSKQPGSKVRTEKTKNRPASQTVQDIIPGKLNSNDWSGLLCDDESEDVASEIVADILRRTLDESYLRYIQRQTIPFTVYEVSRALCDMMELEYIALDAGDPNIKENTEWAPDKVCKSSRIDSWAQGAISKRHVSVKADQTPVADICQKEQLSSDKEEASANNEDTEPKKTFEEGEKKERNKRIKKEKAQHERRATPIEQRTHIPGWSKRTGPFLFTPYTGPLGSPNISRMSETLDEAEFKEHQRKIDQEKRRRVLVAKKPEKRFVGSGQFTYDDEGNLIGVPKITFTPTCGLPKKFAQTVPPATPSTINNKINLKCRILSRPFSEIRASAEMNMAGAFSDPHLQKSAQDARPDSYELARQQRVRALSHGLPNVSDLIELVAGVTISDGERVRVGPSSSQYPGLLLENRLGNLNEVKTLNESQFSPAKTPPVDPRELVNLDSITVVKPTGKV